MAFLQYILTKDDEDRRLNRVLKKFLQKDIPLSVIYKSLRIGKIKINGKKAKPDYRTKQNDVLLIDSVLLQDSAILTYNTARNCERKKCETSKNCDKNKANALNKSGTFYKANALKKLYENLEIIFENEYVKIINKPYDIPVQKAKDELSLDDCIKNAQKTNDSLSFKSGPLHRLDKKTTGVLVFSNNLVGAKEFSAMLQEHKITKTYLTIVEGYLESEYIWKDLIEKESVEKKSVEKESVEKKSVEKKMIEKESVEKESVEKPGISQDKNKGKNQFNTVNIVDSTQKSTELHESSNANHSQNANNTNAKIAVSTQGDNAQNAKVAITKITPLEYGKYNNNQITLCKVNIYTGRTHQIRSQCAFHGFPILGDTAYNKNTKPISNKCEFFLHAYEMEFPQNNKLNLPTKITAPLPKLFADFLAMCKSESPLL